MPPKIDRRMIGARLIRSRARFVRAATGLGAEMQSLFGTRMTADINLVAQIVLIVGLWVGFFLARRKKFANHANVQTAIVLANLVFIFFAMGISFYDYVIKGGTGDSVARWMIVHGVLGTIAEVAGIYLIVRMR